MSEKEGWGKVSNSAKWHYWEEGKGVSLCGKWGYFLRPELEQGNDESTSNCAGCAKKLAKKKAKATV